MKASKEFILMLVCLFVFTGKGYSSSMEELESLPYLAWSDKPDQNPSGVVKYNKDKALEGYNFYTDFTQNVYLMDMAGRIVYRWKLPVTKGIWQYVKLLHDGNIMALSIGGEHFVKLLFEGGLFVEKLDKHSTVIWRTALEAHHDIEALPDGTFLLPAVERPVIYHNRCVFFDSIVHLSENGKILDKWSTYENFKDLQKLHLTSLLDQDAKADIVKDPLQCALKSNGEVFDYYHLNSIQALPDTDLGLKDKRFQKGNWLVGSRGTNLIFILDKDTHQAVWSWGPGVLDGPHMPKMLKNGHILVYDNGLHRSYSRLLIIDPLTNKIIWEYKAHVPVRFHSREAGSSQQLSNGNFLITETLNGRVFEITPGGEIVWEFFNPELNTFGRRATIYRMMRIPKEEVSGWLEAK